MKKLLMWILVCLTCGGAGFFIAKATNPKLPFQSVKEFRSGQYGFINPLIEYEVSEGTYLSKLSTFDDDIKKIVTNYKNDGVANVISVYFRSLNDGPWFGVDEDTNYFPASLLKLPIAIAYFKISETTNPGILDQKITYTKETLIELGDFNQGQFFKSSKQIEVGKAYSVMELITYMIEYSDNNAKNLLIINMKDLNNLYTTYTDLGIATPPELQGDKGTITTHEYASFLRALYNATYLNKVDSNKLLDLLSHTGFDSGLVAGVPEGIIVSHKFGEHTDNNYKQLHDCGIVYYPGNPYILCIMSRGPNFENLQNIISTISRSVYEHVDKQAKGGQTLRFPTPPKISTPRS